MQFIDTHTHPYDEAFDEDRPQVMQRAVDSGVARWIFPGIDSTSFAAQLDLYERWKSNAYMGMGLHPTSVGENWKDELQFALKTELFENRLIVETNFGVLSDYSGNNSASNLVGEFDIHYKLTRDGRFMINFYNHSNYNSNFSTFSFDRLAPYTQGLGLSYSKTFDKFSDLFRRKKTIVQSGPLIDRNNAKTNP